jgi:hypothetical protein
VSQVHRDHLARWTNVALVVAASAALIGVILRGDMGVALDVVALLLLGTLPALRVAVLAVRWGRSGDRRYASAAIGLLLLMVIGVVVVATWR